MKGERETGGTTTLDATGANERERDRETEETREEGGKEMEGKGQDELENGKGEGEETDGGEAGVSTPRSLPSALGARSHPPLPSKDSTFRSDEVSIRCMTEPRLDFALQRFQTGHPREKPGLSNENQGRQGKAGEMNGSSQTGRDPPPCPLCGSPSPHLGCRTRRINARCERPA